MKLKITLYTINQNKLFTAKFPHLLLSNATDQMIIDQKQRKDAQKTNFYNWIDSPAKHFIESRKYFIELYCMLKA